MIGANVAKNIPMNLCDGPTSWARSHESMLSGDYLAEGFLRLDEHGISLEIPDAELMSFRSHYPPNMKLLNDSVKHIFGKSQSGSYLVLVDVRLRSSTTNLFTEKSEQTIHARHFLCSNDVITVDMLQQIEGIGIEGEFDSLQDCEAISSSSLKLDVSSGGKSLKIIFKEPKNFQSFKAVLQEVIDLMTIVHGRFIQINGVALLVSGTKESISYYDSNHLSARQGERSVSILGKGSDSGTLISNMISNWFDSSQELRYAGMIHSSLYRGKWVMPIELNFFSHAHVLEYISKEGAELISIPKNDFVSYRDFAICNSRTLDEENWIRNRLSGNQKGQRRLLDELFVRYGHFFDWLIPDSKKFIKKHIKFRNSIAHINSSLIAGNAQKNLLDLHAHTEGVRIICTCIFLFLLGVQEDDLIKSLEKSGYANRQIQALRNLYPRS